MTDHRRRHARAFSLVELLVVLAIVALLIGLIVPVLAETRSAARRIRSLSNLRTNAQVGLTYANEHSEQFPNPFPLADDPTLPFTPNQDWVWPPGREGLDGWSYGEGPRAGVLNETPSTEGFGYHWLAHVQYADREKSDAGTFVAPGDTALQAWIKKNGDPSARPTRSWLPPTSYWYPPVFWQSPERFRDASTRPARPANNYLIRRNKVSDCIFPSRKVFLFENRDYESKFKPMWNDSTAITNVATVDGSASRVKMAMVVAKTTPFTSGEPGKLDLPSGRWQPPTGEMELRFHYGESQGFDWHPGKPAYFWRTRNGVRGRDLP